MGKRSTFTGLIRVQGVGDRAGRRQTTPVPLSAAKKVAVADASQAAGTIEGLALPQGAIVTRISMIEGVTGGTAPTINIGLNFKGSETDDPDALAVNLPVTANQVVDVAAATAGALFGTALLEDADLTVGTGTGTSGTGGVDLIVEYTFDDDGNIQP